MRHCRNCKTSHPEGYRCYIGAVTIDEWFDRQSRTWVVQLKDAGGNQIGDAERYGTKAQSAYAVGTMLGAAPKLTLTTR